MKVYYNDNEPFCCEVLRARIADGSLPNGVVDERDIRDVRADDLAGFSQCHFFAGIGGFPLGFKWAGLPESVNVWTGGFPCQDLSSAGKGAGLKGKRSGLYWHWFALVAQCRPAWLVAENVPAIRTRGIDHVIASLEGVGYGVADPSVVGAWAVGAPHKRDRVWIVGRKVGDAGCRNGDGRAKGTGAEQARKGVTPSTDCVDELAHPKSSDGRLLLQPGESRGCSVEFERNGQGAVADTESRGQRADGGALGDTRHADQRGKVVADAEGGAGARERQPIGMGWWQFREAVHQGAIWPARPGEPQHEWEAPRLVERTLGAPVDGIPEGLVQRIRQLRGWGDARAEVWWRKNKVRIENAKNRHTLKAGGNGLLPQIPYLIARWIMDAESGKDTPMNREGKGVENG